MEESFQTQLRCRRRGRGEGLRELAQDIRHLMTLAYPGEKSTMAEHSARDVFLTALDDPEFGFYKKKCTGLILSVPPRSQNRLCNTVLCSYVQFMHSY